MLQLFQNHSGLSRLQDAIEHTCLELGHGSLRDWLNLQKFIFKIPDDKVQPLSASSSFYDIWQAKELHCYKPEVNRKVRYSEAHGQVNDFGIQIVYAIHIDRAFIISKLKEDMLCVNLQLLSVDMSSALARLDFDQTLLELI